MKTIGLTTILIDFIMTLTIVIMIRPQKNAIITLLVSITVIFCCSYFPSCKPVDQVSVVVVYTSVDQNYSEPVLKKFESESGIRVLPVYDVEAAKTTGLVNRLLAEKNRPRADVFWNGEFAQTIVLKEQGILSVYNSPAAQTIPPQYRDADYYWNGFAGRARVLIVNTDLLSSDNYPDSIFDLLETKYPAQKTSIAYPMFGTTATHAAALYAAMGREKARAFFVQLKNRGIQVVDGNSMVRDLVASGQHMMGLTDTDDACGALRNKAPVSVIFPDQDTLGTLVIPNTVALINNSPHRDKGEKLIDYLLSPETESLLVSSGWSHIALRPTDIKPQFLTTSNIKDMNVNLQEVYSQLEIVKKDMPEIFIR